MLGAILAGFSQLLSINIMALMLLGSFIEIGTGGQASQLHIRMLF